MDRDQMDVMPDEENVQKRAPEGKTMDKAEKARLIRAVKKVREEMVVRNRKTNIIVGAVALVVGVALGIGSCALGLVPVGGTDSLFRGMNPAAQETEAPEDTSPVMGSIENPIPANTAYTFSTEIIADGSPRYTTGEETFDTVQVTIAVRKHMTSSDYQTSYGDRYKLAGDEASVGMDVTLDSTTGSAVFIPQNALLMRFETETGERDPGYQLMDAEIVGKYGVPVASGETKTLYKWYAYTAEKNVKYLIVTYYQNGEEHTVYFSLAGLVNETAPVVVEATPEPEITVEPTTAAYTTLQNGDKNEQVIALQQRLIDLGYLSGEADGAYGGNTEKAVRYAQAQAGLNQTGAADPEFQSYIFSEEAQAYTQQ